MTVLIEKALFWGRVNFVNKARGKSADMHPADRNTWHSNETAALENLTEKKEKKERSKQHLRVCLALDLLASARFLVSLCHALITWSRHGVLRWWISVWLPGLSSNKEVSAEPILACAEHCFTQERVARETLYNQMVDDAPSWRGDGDEDGDAAFFLLCSLFCGCARALRRREMSFTGDIYHGSIAVFLFFK